MGCTPDSGFEERGIAGVHVEPLDDGRADEVFDLDADLAIDPVHLHIGLGRLVDEELTVLLVGTQLYDPDLVGELHGTAHLVQLDDAPMLVPILQPVVGLKLLASSPSSRIHDLRHTCATLLLAKGVHAKLVQELLGHSTISITLDTYSHVLPGMGDAAAGAMDEALG